MADPVAWKVVERGWGVYGRDGEQLGKVEDVIGDPSADIFNGLAVASGVFSHAKNVPSERVTGIFEGRVETSLSPDELDALPAYQP